MNLGDVNTCFIPLFIIWSMIIIACIVPQPVCLADELEDTDQFVITVLAKADRNELGLQNEPVSRKNGSAVDDYLPDDLRQYLQGLVAVSSALDGEDLIPVLWDDSFVIEEDQDPHEVFNRYRGTNADHPLSPS